MVIIPQKSLLIKLTFYHRTPDIPKLHLKLLSDVGWMVNFAMPGRFACSVGTDIRATHVYLAALVPNKKFHNQIIIFSDISQCNYLYSPPYCTLTICPLII